MFDEEGRAIHAVRRCQSVCIRMVWHRDVNACLNIMCVFIYEWINVEWINGLCPGVFTRAFQREITFRCACLSGRAGSKRASTQALGE